MASREERAMAGLYALSALRYYEPVFPDDTLPFHAAAALIGYGNGERDLADVLAYREQLHDRIDTLAGLDGDRGYISAAIRALKCLLAGMADSEEFDLSDVRRMLDLAQKSVVGAPAP